MALHRPVLLSSLSVLAALAQAQPAEQVTVTGRMIGPPLGVGGFGDVPLARLPLAASRTTAGQFADTGASNVSELTRLDAGISDAYNAEGYWNQISVRGFVLENRFNYRRDGLPINAETSFALHNVDSVEVLKGTSGMQAGTSAPGGIVNLVVKRPEHVRSATLGWRERGSVVAAVDIGERFGEGGRHGLRLNAAAERLQPLTRDTDGRRHLVALAAETALGAGVLEAEIEHARQSQPSVPGFSLLGAVVPDADDIDPRVNLNNQPWSLPVVLQGTTASLRWRQPLGAGWRFTAHGMTQRLRNEDRVAFPFGCSAEDAWDRYCSDGSFDFYDFRSEGERRRSDALDLQFAGRAATGPLTHELAAGVLLTRFESRFQRQAYNWSGIGQIDGSVVVPPAPELTDENTNRDERSTEWYVRDRVELAPDWSLWAGVRHSRLARDSVRTDGSRPTGYTQSLTTPWLAVAHQWTRETMLYASWGQGMESDVAPNRARYTNAGEALPALKSRQFEVGVKHDGRVVDTSVALFDIERPLAVDVGACDDDDTCTRRIDGSARHRGAEALLSWRGGPWQLHGSAMWLQARRRGSSDAAMNGLRPTNVAERTLRLYAVHEPAALPGLALTATLVHEGERMALPDNSARVPAWSRLDLGARYVHDVGATRLVWRAGLDNATDRRAWKEAPYQFGHAYLYPLAPRTWRLSLQTDF